MGFFGPDGIERWAQDWIGYHFVEVFLSHAGTDAYTVYM